MNAEAMQQQQNMNANDRLDTEDIKTKIEQMLKGEFIVREFDYDNQTVKEKKSEYGEPLLNDEGIQTVMTLVNSRISKHTALSNLSEQRYNEILESTHKSLASNLIPKRIQYSPEGKEVGPQECQYIIEVVMGFIKIFLTRPIDDGERQHLQQTTQVQEVTQRQEDTRSSGFLNFGGN